MQGFIPHSATSNLLILAWKHQACIVKHLPEQQLTLLKLRAVSVSIIYNIYIKFALFHSKCKHDLYYILLSKYGSQLTQCKFRSFNSYHNIFNHIVKVQTKGDYKKLWLFCTWKFQWLDFLLFGNWFLTDHVSDPFFKFSVLWELTLKIPPKEDSVSS